MWASHWERNAERTNQKRKRFPYRLSPNIPVLPLCLQIPHRRHSPTQTRNKEVAARKDDPAEARFQRRRPQKRSLPPPKRTAQGEDEMQGFGGRVGESNEYSQVKRRRWRRRRWRRRRRAMEMAFLQEAHRSRVCCIFCQNVSWSWVNW